MAGRTIAENPLVRLVRLNAGMDLLLADVRAKQHEINQQQAAEAAYQRQKREQIQRGEDPATLLDKRVAAAEGRAECVQKVATKFAEVAFKTYLCVRQQEAARVASKQASKAAAQPAANPEAASKSASEAAPATPSQSAAAAETVKATAASAPELVAPTSASSPTKAAPSPSPAASEPALVRAISSSKKTSKLGDALQQVIIDEFTQLLVPRQAPETAAPRPASTPAPAAVAPVTQAAPRPEQAQLEQKFKEQQERIAQLELLVARLLPQQEPGEEKKQPI